MTCYQCQNWTVNKAHFCHHCGYTLASSNSSTFEYATGSNSSNVQNLAPTTGGRQSIKDKSATFGLIGLAMAIGTLFADWSPAYIALAPVGYLLLPHAQKLVLDLAGKLPKVEKSEHTTIKVTHVEKSETGKNLILDFYPPEIELRHIRHIADVCLPLPEGRGLNFSRPAVCKTGKLSQGEFKIIRDIWLESHHAFYKNPLEHRQGLILTERCKRLLRKSLLVD